MKALTLIQPMGWAIVHGTKRIENRPRDLPKSMRGVETVVVVHSGKKWSDEYANTVSRIMGVTSIGNVKEPSIVGLMRLTGRVFKYDKERLAELQFDDLPLRVGDDGQRRLDDWFSGPFGYEIASAVAFPGPIPCKGMLGFWTVPLEIEEQISRACAIEERYR